jgi:organic radical activating enzyme
MFSEAADMKRFLEVLSEISRPVIVFGASVIGKVVLDSLDILSVRPVAFCDNDVRKQRELFYGYRVIPFEKMCADYPSALVIVAAGRYFDEIRKQLSTAGFKDVFSDSDIISCIDFKKTPHSKLERIMWYLAKIGKLSEMMEFPSNSLHIPRLNVVVSTRCTLKCTHCSSLMAYYRKPSDFDASGIIASLDRILSCVDLIYHVEILGGEPFLHKELPLIAKHLADSGKILHIDVVTNGTIVPPERELDSLKHERLSVVIDDYGALSKKIDSLSDALQHRGVDFRVSRHWAWADLGNFESRNRSEEQLTELFAKCNFNSCSELLDGRLYRCPRSSHGTNTSLVPEYKDDFIDVLDESLNRNLFKKRLKSFFYDKQFIYSCNHCNGNTIDSLTLSPAEQ